MPTFTPKSHEQILAGMLAKVISRTNLNDVGDAAALKHVLSASARQDSEQYYQMSLLLQLFSIDTAVGEDLDARAKEIQPGTITRLAAKKAVGTVIFSRAGVAGTVTIPVGTRIKTGNGVEFLTTSQGTISPTSPVQITGHITGQDSNLISVAAAIAGSAGNVASGVVNKFSSKPAGVDSVINLAPFVQGTDLETDDSFRARIKAYVASLARCTVGSIESNIIGQQDPVSGATALFCTVWEDLINRGNIIVYVDDGTGTAESIGRTALALTGTWTWAGTTTILSTDTSGVSPGDYIRLDSAPTSFFQISGITPNVSVTILNPGSLTIPSGATGSSKATENVTQGLSGPPVDTAVGGEITLFLANKPVRASEPWAIISSTRGLLTRNADYLLNEATGQLDFTPALSTGEQIEADYSYEMGLVGFVQKLVDGDPNDRATYPGLRAAGIYALVKTPQVLFQVVNATLAVKDGYDLITVQANVREAIKTYINTLSISGDLILADLTRYIMEVPGVYDVIIATPTANVPMLDDQMARITDSNITVT